MNEFWGLSYLDIVNYFSAIEQNFATPNKNSGKKNIELVMETEKAKIISMLPTGAQQLLEYVDGIEATVTELSGGGYAIYAPSDIPMNVEEEIKLYKTSDALNNNVHNVSGCYKNKMNTWEYATQVTDFTVETDENGVAYLFVESFDGNAWLSYSVDESNFEVIELKAFLMDKTACICGSKLLMVNEDKWALLDIVCATEFKPATNWIPSVYKKYKWLKKPWTVGITNARIYRN